MLSRGLPLLALGICAWATPATAQGDIGSGSFKFFFGAYGGVTVFETDAQNDKAAPMGGAEIYVTARRTAVRLSVEEVISTDNLAAFSDPTASGGVRQVTFNDIRRYNLMLIAMPLQGAIQPFIGVGVGWQHLYNPHFSGAAADPDALMAEVKQRSSVGYGSGIVGVQIRTHGVALFGSYQITSAPSEDKLLVGPTHTLSGGLRFSLGGTESHSY
jgi:hypothetical protein